MLTVVFARFVAACVLALAAAGCASVDERGRSAADVAAGMFRAVAGDDGTAACGMLAPETRSEVEQSHDDAPCAQAILDEDLPEPGPVTGTSVYGQWAQVRFSGDTVFLAVFPDGWRVVAAACEPRPDRPYDCRIQGG
jgi:hypothetical protein